MRKKTMLIIMPLVLIIPESLPYGAVLNFGFEQPNGQIGSLRQTTSYFDLLPFGYANWGPLLTAILSCVILVVTICYVVRPADKLKRNIFCLMMLAFVTSIFPLLMLGIKYYSFLGLCISMGILLEATLLKKIST